MKLVVKIGSVLFVELIMLNIVLWATPVRDDSQDEFLYAQTSGEVIAEMQGKAKKVSELQVAQQQSNSLTLFAVKTNLLYDLGSVVNYSVEVPIGMRTSLLFQHHCPWWHTADNKYRLELQSLGAEARFWMKPKEGKKLSGHFIGVYGLSGTTDLQYDREIDLQAKFWSSGLSYGYAFILNNALRLELSISGGYLVAPLTHYVPSDDYSVLYRDLDRKDEIFTWWGPTKAEVSLVWSINAPRKAGRGK